MFSYERQTDVILGIKPNTSEVSRTSFTLTHIWWKGRKERKTRSTPMDCCRVNNNKAKSASPQFDQIARCSFAYISNETQLVVVVVICAKEGWGRVGGVSFPFRKLSRNCVLHSLLFRSFAYNVAYICWLFYSRHATVYLSRSFDIARNPIIEFQSVIIAAAHCLRQQRPRVLRLLPAHSVL